jgi:hypothetical protein
LQLGATDRRPSRHARHALDRLLRRSLQGAIGVSRIEAASHGSDSLLRSSGEGCRP